MRLLPAAPLRLLFAQAKALSRLAASPANRCLMSRAYCIAPPVSGDPCDLFAFALDQLTWEHVRDLLPADEAGRRWTVATAGPLSLLAYAATDDTATLSDWTDWESSPELFAAQDRGDLWHFGLIVEIACSGQLLSHESVWACCLDTTNHTTERDSYAHFLDEIKQLSREACAYAPNSIATKLQQLSTASAVILGLEEPYQRTLGF